MPFNFSRVPNSRLDSARSTATAWVLVADHIAQAEAIDRRTPWPTLRIRACLSLQTKVPRTTR